MVAPNAQKKVLPSNYRRMSRAATEKEATQKGVCDNARCAGQALNNRDALHGFVLDKR